MPKKKVTVVKNKVVKEEILSPLQKNEARAKVMIANDKKEEARRKEKAFLDYKESKVIRGHSEEEATAMAKSIIYNETIIKG